SCLRRVPVHDEHPNYLVADRGVKSWLTTIDHKRIGILFLIGVLGSLLIGGIFALLLRLELLTPGRTYIDALTYNRFFTLHRIIMVFMFMIPSIPAAFGNFFLQIMIGAKDVAFPRLYLFSFYLIVTGVAVALFST